jgi:6-phosphofructokinase 1
VKESQENIKSLCICNLLKELVASILFWSHWVIESQGEQNLGMSSDSSSESGVLLFVAIAVAASVASQYLYTHNRDKCYLQEKVATTETRELPAIPSAPKLSRQPSMNINLLGDSASIKGNRLEGASIDEIYVHEITNLRNVFPTSDIANDMNSSAFRPQAYNKMIGKEDFIINDIVRKYKGRGSSDAYIRAGPRATLHFSPTEVKAAIVTCGGLCPGLNNVVRELVRALVNLYHVDTIYGIRGGFLGFHEKVGYEPEILTLEKVTDIHHQGGTILASARGGFDKDVIINFLLKHGINQIYIIGGDGTHRGANALAEECLKRNLNISVAGIPKTIDNDVDIIDRSFGFTTSVEAAQAAIMSAKIEARCNMPNGIGIVKLMGRSSGFIATHATLASGDVDLCLVPEVSMVLDGPNGCLSFLMERVRKQGHAVIVVAEGAGEEVLGKSTEKDAGGNRKLPPIGEFLKAEISKYFKEQGIESTVKYIDPSYMIRFVL